MGGQVTNVIIKVAAPAALATLTCKDLKVSSAQDDWRSGLEVCHAALLRADAGLAACTAVHSENQPLTCLAQPLNTHLTASVWQRPDDWLKKVAEVEDLSLTLLPTNEQPMTLLPLLHTASIQVLAASCTSLAVSTWLVMPVAVAAACGVPAGKRTHTWRTQVSLLAPVFKLLSPQPPRRGEASPTAQLTAHVAPVHCACSSLQLACLWAGALAARQHAARSSGMFCTFAASCTHVVCCPGCAAVPVSFRMLWLTCFMKCYLPLLSARLEARPHPKPQLALAMPLGAVCSPQHTIWTGPRPQATTAGCQAACCAGCCTPA